MLRLSLICSGITRSARGNRFPEDGPIEDRSIKLARRLATRLKPSGITFVSPLIRARETAGLLGLDAVVNDVLRDQDFGDWAGRAFDEVHAESPQTVADTSFQIPNGESVAAVATRAESFLKEAGQLSGHIVAVTHGMFVKTAIASILEAPLSSVWRIDAPPLSVTDLRHDGHRWALRALTTIEENEI